MLANDSQVLTVRLPTNQKRRLKSLAASLGLTLPEAVAQALEAWASQLQARGHNPLEPSEPAAKKRPRRRPQENAPSPEGSRSSAASLAGGRALNLKGAALEQFRRLGRLDWSQCPAAESVSTKIGRVWVFRGTRIPLARVLRDIQADHPPEEIFACYRGLNPELLAAVLQFASQRLPKV